MKFPFRPSPTVRLTIGMLSLTVTLILGTDMLIGIFPDTTKTEIQTRRQLSESIALQMTTLLTQYNTTEVNRILPSILQRDARLYSIGVRTADSRLLIGTARHGEDWKRDSEGTLNRSHFIIPVSSADQPRWGQIEIAFAPLDGGLTSYLTPSVKMLIVFFIAGTIFYYLYLRRSLLHLDPSAAIPDRVQTAFDAMNDAIVILDAQSRIVMTNLSFDRLKPDANENLISRTLDSLTWIAVGRENTAGSIPWSLCMQNKRRSGNEVFEAKLPSGRYRRLITTASPLLDTRGNAKGCLVSFNDVTELDEANEQLVLLMADLTASKEKLEEQNAQLQQLAEVDPMTGARNRRAFFPQFERLFTEAKERELPLSFIMADIDKFKNVNDTYGHGIGDKVIQKFASIMLVQARDSDIVCRYGGEEFCIALPGATLDQAFLVAERIRKAVQAEVGPSLPLNPQPTITASFGVSTIATNVGTASELAELADQALYQSKHNGRNRCTKYHDSAQTRATAA